MEKNTQKTIITVVGKDTVGIIAGICTYLAENGINVLDISQTIVQDYFNMMMIVDIAACQKHFAECQADLRELREKISVDVKCQREKKKKKMHRI